MSGGNHKKKSKKSFEEVLENGALVDDIFKDSPAPPGSNPFNELEEPTLLLEPGESPKMGSDESLLASTRKLAALEELFKLVTRDCTFGELASEILRIAMTYVPSDAGSLLEIDYQNQCMFFRAVTGRSSKNLLSFTVPIGQGIVGFVCENQQVMNLSAVDDNNMYLRAISDSVGFDTKNLVAFPIIIRGVSFGCLELLNRMGQPTYTDADLEVLSTICDAASKVIENRLLNAALWQEAYGIKKDEAA